MMPTQNGGSPSHHWCGHLSAPHNSNVSPLKTHSCTLQPAAQSWRGNWEQVIPFFAFAPEVRKIIYTTNAIESLHSQVRKAVRGRGHFPSDEAASKLIWLVLRNISAKWKSPPIYWHAAKAQLALQFQDRFIISA